MVYDFVTAEDAKGADGQVDRAAPRLGIIATAGELATVFGLTGWREGEARKAAAWRSSVGLKLAAGPNRPKSGKPSRRFGISPRRTAKRALTVSTVLTRAPFRTGPD